MKVGLGDGHQAYRTAGLGSTLYEASALTVNTGVDDYNVKTTGSMFDIVTPAHFVEIRTTHALTVKLNSTANDSITIASADSPYIIDQVEVSNIFVSNNSGNQATVRIFIA